MSLPLTDALSILGDEKVALQVNRYSRRVAKQDVPELFQQVHLELLTELGKDYREQIGSSAKPSDVDSRVTRCVDRVSKRIERARKIESIDQILEVSGHMVPDPKSKRGHPSASLTSLLAIQFSELACDERRMLDMLRAEFSSEEIAAELGMGRNPYFQFKRRVFAKLAGLLA